MGWWLAYQILVTAQSLSGAGTLDWDLESGLSIVRIMHDNTDVFDHGFDLL